MKKTIFAVLVLVMSISLTTVGTQMDSTQYVAADEDMPIYIGG